MRSGSISPSTSIRSSIRSSDSEDSDDTSRYAGMSAEELNTIWERRNLAYFHRRQRKLAEARQQQQQDLSGGDGNSVGSCRSDSSDSAHEQLGEGVASSSPSSPPHPQRERGQQRTRPGGFVCAADDPTWQAFTSRNIMGDYDSERASRDPAYHHAWVSCERLVNMRRSCASAGNFIPTNPRLAALLEHRRLEVARERYEEAQQQFSQVGAPQQDRNDNMILDDSASQEPSPFESSSTQHVAEQAAECERLNQADRLQKASHAQGNSSNLKTPSLESSAGEKNVQMKTPSPESSAGKKSVQMPVQTNDYYIALPFPTPRLPKSVYCEKCNCELFTAPFAKQFFCQTCGCVTRVPVPDDVDADFDEKMQDAEDQDYQNMCYY